MLRLILSQTGAALVLRSKPQRPGSSTQAWAHNGGEGAAAPDGPQSHLRGGRSPNPESTGKMDSGSAF